MAYFGHFVCHMCGWVFVVLVRVRLRYSDGGFGGCDVDVVFFCVVVLVKAIIVIIILDV